MNNAPQRSAFENGNPAFGQLAAFDRAEGVTLASGAVDKDPIHPLLNQSSSQSFHTPQVHGSVWGEGSYRGGNQGNSDRKLGVGGHGGIGSLVSASI